MLGFAFCTHVSEKPRLGFVTAELQLKKNVDTKVVDIYFNDQEELSKQTTTTSYFSRICKMQDAVAPHLLLKTIHFAFFAEIKEERRLLWVL